MTPRARDASPARQRGFTLAELAVVVTIVALLIGGVLMTVAAQNSVREVRDTQRTLDTAREALLGFAVANGRFPCPAGAPPPPATPAGPFAVEAFNAGLGGNPVCAAAEGFLPAITLGLGPTDRFGYLLDAWGNPLRYAVSDFVQTPPVAAANCPPNTATPTFANCPTFTTARAIVTLGFAAMPTAWSNSPAWNPGGLLRVCTTWDCTTGPVINTPAIVWSPGRNFQSVGAASPDEQANAAATAGDRTFVAREPSPATAPNGEFDDLTVWIPAAVLYGRLVAASGL